MHQESCNLSNNIVNLSNFIENMIIYIILNFRAPRAISKGDL